MRLTGGIGAAALALLVATGCSKQEGAATGNLGKDAPQGGLGSNMGAQVSEASSAASQQLASTFSTQLQQQQTAVDSLKLSAKQYADQKLNGLLSQLDTELKSATAKVSELKSAGADSAKAIQADLQDMMSQITDLVDQAKGRLAELAVAKP